MEKGEAGVVGDKIDFYFLETTEHHDVFHDTGGMLAANLCDFKAVAM